MNLKLEHSKTLKDKLGPGCKTFPQNKKIPKPPRKNTGEYTQQHTKPPLPKRQGPHTGASRAEGHLPTQGQPAASGSRFDIECRLLIYTSVYAHLSLSLSRSLCECVSVCVCRSGCSPVCLRCEGLPRWTRSQRLLVRNPGPTAPK